MKKSLLTCLACFAIATSAHADLLVYGPGGPAPVLKELAAQFEAQKGQKVQIIAGPTPQWINDAKVNADIIFAGNSSMMDGFIKAMPNSLNVKDVEVLNIREAGIVVRKNNPKNIKKFADILKDGIKVMVVDGAGQVGLYEDMALKGANQQNLVKLRENIAYYAPNSKLAVERWNSDESIDALIIWSHWAKVLGDKKAEFVSLKDDAVIYRSAEIAVTINSQNKAIAQEFVKFVQSKEAQKVWIKWGWESK